MMNAKEARKITEKCQKKLIKLKVKCLISKFGRNVRKAAYAGRDHVQYYNDMYDIATGLALEKFAKIVVKQGYGYELSKSGERVWLKIYWSKVNGT